MDELARVVHAHWPRLRLGDRLGGGNRNLVHAGHLDGCRVAVRRGRRSGPSLAWELDLLRALDRAGFVVPRPLPATDGSLQHDGVCVLSWLDGEEPASESHWRDVAQTLRRLHRFTAGWPRRPGFAGTRELLRVDAGGDVDLRAMPAGAVAACRAAWAGIADEPRSVVHGDPGAANVRIGRAGVGLIDWDEARVDASVLDLAEHPHADALIEPDVRRFAVRRAATAWEAANGWRIEPDYARRKLDTLHAMGAS